MLNNSPHLNPFLQSKQESNITALNQIRAEKARRDLKEFIRQAWHVLEPSAVYVENWHIDAICDHLMACSRGEITKLGIAIPPGHCKSLLSSVFWPAWEWTTKPYLRILSASYASHLSIRDCIKFRTLIQSDWYKKSFGHVFEVEKANEQYITNNKFGFRYASSVGGVGTGERLHRVINDDLLNKTDARSEAMRKQAIEHMIAMSTREVPNEPFIQLLIQQRLNQLDPFGWIEDKKDWVQLVLPCEFEPKRKCVTVLGFEDPRKEEGELIWPALFPREKVDKLKIDLGRYETSAQLQQRPSPEGGGIINTKLIKRFDFAMLPPIQFIIQSWDTAFKDGQENDYSVGLTIAVCNGGFYILNRFKAKLTYPDLKKQIIAVWRQYKVTTILIEDKASGQSLVQDLKLPQVDELNPHVKFKLPVKPVWFDGDKIARVNACTPTLESNLYLPHNADWVDDFLTNLELFPNGAHDDDIDALSQAMNYLVLTRGRIPVDGNSVAMQR